MDIGAAKRQELREKLSDLVNSGKLTIKGPGFKTIDGIAMRDPWTIININAIRAFDANQILDEVASAIEG